MKYRDYTDAEIRQIQAAKAAFYATNKNDKFYLGQESDDVILKKDKKFKDKEASDRVKNPKPRWREETENRNYNLKDRFIGF